MYILFLDFKFFPAKKFLLKDNVHITFFFRGIDRLLYVPSPSSIYIYPHTYQRPAAVRVEWKSI